MTPFTLAASPEGLKLASAAITNFAPGANVPGLPPRAQLMAWYAEVAGWDPRPEANWGDAFGLLRNSVIMQGIKARVALRQATSAQAKSHADRMEPFGEYAWKLVQKAKSRSASKASL
jgi:aminoglycoside phosphotransferase (APT) family kinase protein